MLVQQVCTYSRSRVHSSPNPKKLHLEMWVRLPIIPVNSVSLLLATGEPREITPSAGVLPPSRIQWPEQCNTCLTLLNPTVMYSTTVRPSMDDGGYSSQTSYNMSFPHRRYAFISSQLVNRFIAPPRCPGGLDIHQTCLSLASCRPAVYNEREARRCPHRPSSGR